MSSAALARVARARLFTLRPRLPVCQNITKPALAPASAAGFASSSKRLSADPHQEESFEEFTARYEKEFDSVQDVFELQRNLNNAFAYDLVPAPSVIIAALRAARRVNDFPTAVRIFEGIKAKVENQGQYDEYVEELKPIRDELGVNLKEAMYPEPAS
ncbi:Cytochrome c oxidase subunit 6 [Saxophila tyrrhenica]|uniref:Cytochrome c oxidase subunit 6, mitochondrial n=1 Tax=Saxophila tyrrhenica TaxID=1690608 RepID=A0AAV9P1P7_9PEZI|nr:Cytochrome c oxidase subunit 6 [Saxophila tyrrhenica]